MGGYVFTFRSALVPLFSTCVCVKRRLHYIMMYRVPDVRLEPAGAQKLNHIVAGKRNLWPQHNMKRQRNYRKLSDKQEMYHGED